MCNPLPYLDLRSLEEMREEVPVTPPPAATPARSATHRWAAPSPQGRRCPAAGIAMRDARSSPLCVTCRRGRTDAEARVEESRARLTKLQEDLPTQFGELRDRLTTDELRKVAESYAEAAQTRYNSLVERGEAALERLRNTNALEEGRERVERYSDQAVELTQEALGNVASQTRAVGERAAKLVGVELPKKAQKAAPAKKAAAKKAPAKR